MVLEAFRYFHGKVSLKVKRVSIAPPAIGRANRRVRSASLQCLSNCRSPYYSACISCTRWTAKPSSDRAKARMSLGVVHSLVTHIRTTSRAPEDRGRHPGRPGCNDIAHDRTDTRETGRRLRTRVSREASRSPLSSRVPSTLPSANLSARSSAPRGRRIRTTPRQRARETAAIQESGATIALS